MKAGITAAAQRSAAKKKKGIRNHAENTNEFAWNEDEPIMSTQRAKSTRTDTSMNKDTIKTTRIELKNALKAQWRRIMSSGNDPYCIVRLRPTHLGFKTKPIYGGGSNVEWDGQDCNEYAFPIGKKPNFKNLYLKISVNDEETGTDDRELGHCRILLSYFASVISDGKLDVPHYASVGLYSPAKHNYAGTLEICGTLRYGVLSDFEDNCSGIQYNSEVKQEINNNNNNNNNGDEIKYSGPTIISTDHLHKTHKSQGSKKVSEIIQNVENLDQLLVDKYCGAMDRGTIINIVLFVAFVFSGILFFGILSLEEIREHRLYTLQVTKGKSEYSFIDSLRWSIVTISTVGYGDMFPQTPGGKLFGSFYILVGVSLLARMVSTLLSYVSEKKEEARVKQLTQRSLTSISHLAQFDENGDGRIDKYEFLKTMLLIRGDVEPGLIDKIMNEFSKYDKDGDETIEIEEVREKIRQEKLRKIGKTDDTINNTVVEMKGKDKTVDDGANTPLVEPAGIISKKTTYKDIFNDEANESKDAQYFFVVEVRACDNLKDRDEAVDVENSFTIFIGSVLGFVIYLCIGAGIFTLVEDSNFGDQLYFFIVTTCTVGYGDISPQTNVGKWLNSIFICTNLFIFSLSFSVAFNYLYAKQEQLLSNKTGDRNIRSMIRKANFTELHNVLYPQSFNKKL